MVRVPSAAATPATAAKPSGIAPAVENQSSEVTRDSAPDGISRPSVVSQSVKPALTPIPASSSKAAIAPVEPAKPMMIGWQAAARKHTTQTSIGRSTRSRYDTTAPRIVPTPKQVTITAQAPAPPSSRSAITGPSASTQGSAIRW